MPFFLLPCLRNTEIGIEYLKEKTTDTDRSLSVSAVLLHPISTNDLVYLHSKMH